MAKIGNWGSYLKFSTNESKVLTFNDLKRDGSYRTTKHNPIGGKPKVEGQGVDLDGVTMSIVLCADLGVRPRKQEEKLRKKRGKIAPLVVGGKKVLSRAMLTRVSSTYDIVLERGEVYKMTVDVTFTEYN